MQNKAYMYVKSKKKLDDTWEISTNKYGDRKISTFLRNTHIHYLQDTALENKYKSYK